MAPGDVIGAAPETDPEAVVYYRCNCTRTGNSIILSGGNLLEFTGHTDELTIRI